MTYERSHYVWPGRYLCRPDHSHRLIYLDLNHWISLARAAVNHSDGRRHERALRRLRQARATGRVIFPLSGVHYMEMAPIRSARQRGDIAMVMEELSGFTTILPRALIMQLEIEAVLDAMLGQREQPYEALPLLGVGVGPAVGLRGGLRIRDAEGRDRTADARQAWPGGSNAFDRKLAAMNLTLEREVLRGPPDDQVEELHRMGWDPDAARREARERAADEQGQAARLDADTRWRRGRIRDVVAARYLLQELNCPASRAIAARGVAHPTDFFTDRAVARTFLDSMPSSDVWVTLAAAAHRNPQRKWTPNDIFDFDAASVAAAYCDVFVGDAHVCNALRTAKIDTRANVTICDNLDDLIALLDSASA